MLLLPIVVIPYRQHKALKISSWVEDKNRREQQQQQQQEKSYTRREEIRDIKKMGVQTVEVSASNRPGSLMTPATTTTTGSATASATGANDVEKAATSGDQWGKNMQRWRNDNIDIGKGS